MLGRAFGEECLSTRLQRGFAILFVDMEWQSVDVGNYAWAEIPSVLVERLSQQERADEGGIAPQVVLVRRSVRHFLKIKSLDRLGLPAVRQTQQESWQSQTNSA